MDAQIVVAGSLEKGTALIPKETAYVTPGRYGDDHVLLIGPEGVVTASTD